MNIWQLGIHKYISNMRFSNINIVGIMNFYNFKIKVLAFFIFPIEDHQLHFVFGFDKIWDMIHQAQEGGKGLFSSQFSSNSPPCLQGSEL